MVFTYPFLVYISLADIPPSTTKAVLNGPVASVELVIFVTPVTFNVSGIPTPPVICNTPVVGVVLVLSSVIFNVVAVVLPDKDKDYFVYMVLE